MNKTIKAHYLKHAGSQIDVKVSIRMIDDQMVIYIRDSEFYSFESALKYLQAIASHEMPLKVQE